MKSKKQNSLMAAVATALVVGTISHAAPETPRGANVSPLAANCNIGHFPQTSKAGPYNALCNVMQDSEKCLALVKGRFVTKGDAVIVRPFDPQDERAQYCMQVLQRDLGLGEE